MFDVESKREVIFERIDNLRLSALNHERAFINELSDEIYTFDQKLQQSLETQFGDANLRKMVPEWHKLVGSTPEDHGADPGAKGYITEQVERFVSEMESKWGL